MKLRVLEGGSDEAINAYAPRSFDLKVQPLRPGIAHEYLELRLGADTVEAVEKVALGIGVPAELWAAIAIESERALRAAAEASNVARGRLAVALDTASAEPRPTLPAQRGRRLAAYARMLRRPDASTLPAGMHRLSVAVAYHTMSAWEFDAARTGASVASWASALLAAMPEGRLQWEAAAAEAGQTLGEWSALHAARLASC